MSDSVGGKGSKRGWTQEELDLLVQMAGDGMTSKEIASALKRSPVAVRLKASRLRISLADREEGEATPEEPQASEATAPVEVTPDASLDAPAAAPATRRKVTYINPRRRSKDDSETRLRTSEFPPKERRGRRWKRYLISLREEEIANVAYTRAMRDIRENLEREIWDILHEHQQRFLHDVSLEFVRSMADEVRERDRQHKEFHRTLRLTRDPDKQDKTEPDDRRDPLEQLIWKETEELNDFIRYTHNRLVDMIDESLVWYWNLRPRLALSTDAAKAYLMEREDPYYRDNVADRSA